MRGRMCEKMEKIEEKICEGRRETIIYGGRSLRQNAEDTVNNLKHEKSPTYEDRQTGITV